MGTGSASAAVMDYFYKQQNGVKIEDHNGVNSTVEWIHGIEPSQSMRDASKMVLSDVLDGQKYTGGKRIVGARTRLKTKLDR